MLQWLDNGWLIRHQSSAREIANLLAIVERDLRDARGEISSDWRFGIAYNAALKLCTILLYAEGFQPEKTLQHYRSIQALPEILGQEKKPDADYLNACRTKRNTAEYDYAGCATQSDANELIAYCEELKQGVLEWLKQKHPDLLQG